MENKSLQRSVDSLQNIYAVIIALAIGKTLQEVFTGNSWTLIKDNFFSALPALLSFFFLVVPFYHGMNRHLDKCYIEKDGEYNKLGLLIDFFFFSIEASLMFIFASFIFNNYDSFIILAIILFIDIFWALISHLINYKEIKPSVINWALINFFTIVLGIFIYALQEFFKIKLSLDISWLFFVLILVRTVVDYWKMKNFYFP